MKILLERRFSDCPQSSPCTVCGQVTKACSSRMILCSDRGLIQGDICPQCVKLKAAKIQRKLSDRASFLLQLSNQTDHSSRDRRERALELLQLAEETVTFPTFYQWWIQKLAILSQENQELESARLGLNQRNCKQRSRLEKMLQYDGE